MHLLVQTVMRQMAGLECDSEHLSSRERIVVSLGEEILVKMRSSMTMAIQQLQMQEEEEER